jgi:hypothetical protein
MKAIRAELDKYDKKTENSLALFEDYKARGCTMRIQKQGSKLMTNCHRLKMKARVLVDQILSVKSVSSVCYLKKKIEPSHGLDGLDG